MKSKFSQKKSLIRKKGSAKKIEFKKKLVIIYFFFFLGILKYSLIICYIELIGHDLFISKEHYKNREKKK